MFLQQLAVNSKSKLLRSFILVVVSTELLRKASQGEDCAENELRVVFFGKPLLHRRRSIAVTYDGLASCRGRYWCPSPGVYALR